MTIRWCLSAALGLMLACRAPAPPPDMRTVEWSQGDGPLPTVILLHGRGDRPEGILPLLRGLPGPVRVVAAAAPIPWGEGSAWFDSPGEDQAPGDLPAELRQQAERIAALARHLQATSRGRPVVTGFSQGGFLAFATAALHPEVIAGAVPIGGMLPPELTSSACGVPVRALHGDADTVIAVAEVRRTVAELKAAGCDVSLREWAGVGHQITPEMREVLWTTLRDLLEGRPGAPPG